MGLLPRRETAPEEPDDVHPGALSAETEAFLGGRLPAALAQRGDAPVWSWLNPIAHGEPATVCSLASGAADDVPSQTMRAIALAVIADGRDLATVQREVLVPLELRHVGEVMTPRRLVELVGRALFGS